MERYAARPDPRRRQGALVASVLVHLLAFLLFWLLPRASATPDVTETVTISERRPVLVELTEATEPLPVVAPQAPPADASKGGGGSAGALKLPGATPVVAFPQPVPIAPVRPITPTDEAASTEAAASQTESRPIGGSGAGTGTGSGSGAGIGAGPGSGTVASTTEAKSLFQMADWIVRPSDADMQKANPFFAKRTGVSGTVLLSCQVTDANRAKNCKTIKESPRGYGFAVAAKNVVRRGLIRPPVSGARNPEDRVFVSITFENRIAGDEG